MTSTDLAVGGPLVVALLGVLGLLVRRLTAQDTGWKGIVDELRGDTASLRAELAIANTKITNLTNELIATRSELAATRSELAATRRKIAEVQAWEERHDS